MYRPAEVSCFTQITMGLVSVGFSFPREGRLMAKSGRKAKGMRHVSFRMSEDVYDDLAALARARGVDVSAVLNWLLTEYHPTLVKKRAEHEKAMLEAATSREWEQMEPTEAMRTLRGVLGKLQDEYAA